MKKFRLSAVLAAAAVCLTVLPLSASAKENDITIIYTNDTHCKLDADIGFSTVAALKQNAIDNGEYAFAVDNGDFSQGGLAGALSDGADIIDIMNSAGYDYVTLGNHEFDYGMDVLKNNIAASDFQYLCSNFEKTDGQSDFFAENIKSYAIAEAGDKKIAFIGITTPYTLTSSNPENFFDKDGQSMYDFCQGETSEKLCNAVQEVIDSAKNDGADYIIGLAHLGTDDSGYKYSSTDVIGGTSGFDAVLDGHSHTVIENQLCSDKDGNNVVLTSTGSHFANIGRLTISNGVISTELVDADKFSGSVITENASLKAAETDGIVAAKLAAVEEKTGEVVGKADYALYVNDPATGERIVRNHETNGGNFCADAYRSILGSDIAIVNGGGVRADLQTGDVTLGNLITINPYGNMLCEVEATGQQILDALELGVSAYPEEKGGFLQVSGMTYEIYSDIPSSVVTDENGMFVSVDGEYRVKNVLVDGVALDLNKSYTVGGISYILMNSGDGFSMFGGCELLQDEVCIDSEALNTYLTDVLGGTIGESYSNAFGNGRITLVSGTPATDSATDSPVSGNTSASVFAAVMIISAAAVFTSRKNKH